MRSSSARSRLHISFSLISPHQCAPNTEKLSHTTSTCTVTQDTAVATTVATMYTVAG